MEVAKWLEKARPRTRLDGYPMFLLARDLLRRMLNKDIRLMRRQAAAIVVAAA